MPTYAIGDVQGCYDTLLALTETIGLSDQDRLWFVGDLVNRGPKSAEVLRWIRGLGHRAQVVLGNHDLHLLAAAAGHRKLKRRDTLGSVLDADDRDDLIDWLRMQPLLHREGDHVMVHAGIHPQWTIAQAAGLAAEVERVLRSDDWHELFAKVRPSSARPWSDEHEGWDRLASILSVLVRIRTCHEDGSLCEDFVGAPQQAPKGCVPWFELPAKRSSSTCVVFGHWSTLGLRIRADHIGLDTGCVWGEKLTAVRLDDWVVFQQDACD